MSDGTTWVGLDVHQATIAIAVCREGEEPRDAGVIRHELGTLLKRLRGGSQDVIGAYHSHPRSPAWPSPTDVAECFSAHFLYVIVSLAGAAPVARAFQIDDGSIRELTIVTPPPR